MILLVVQFAVYEHAAHIAQVTATQGLEAARADGATNATGYAAATGLLAQLGDGVLHDPVVKIDRGAGQVDVSVTGIAETVVPGLRLRVRAHASGPIERFVPAGGG